MNSKGEKIKKFFIIFAAFCLVLMTGYQIILPFFEKIPKKQEVKQNQIINNEELENKSEFKENQLSEIKEDVFLEVPFMPQAPYGIWDDLHNNACEEAALIMVHYFLLGKNLDKETMEREIQNLVNWQIKNWGEHKDLTLEEVGKLAKEYYGWQKIRILDRITIEEIKKELSKGNPVIVPAAGRLLGNPYYRRPGPYYHMLVIRGYKKNKIITNDPGTRRGEKFLYSSEILYQAIHDWPGEGKDILEGEKRGLIIEK
ncbi:MAG: C39 family peptidase [Patescibacteria group bacterium]